MLDENMNCHQKVKEALCWYNGQQGNWKPIVKFLEKFFIGEPQRILAIIETWPEPYHYGAILYLRIEYGYQVYAVDSENKNSFNYKYRKNESEDWQLIVPLHKRDIKREEKYFEYLLSDDFNPKNSHFNIPNRPNFLL